MPGGMFDALAQKKADLIRKSLDGSAFIAPSSADPIANLTEMSTDPTPVPQLAALPLNYEDLGYETSDGMSFARSVSQSEVTSFGSITPTRTDIVSDTETMVVVAQETKALTIGLFTGADPASFVPDPTTGELAIVKPPRPSAKHYRVLAVSLDEGAGGEIYIARFMPYAKVTDYAEQAFSGGDTTTNWGVTFTAEVDSVLGFATTYLFGGAGWLALLDEMGFTVTP